MRLTKILILLAFLCTTTLTARADDSLISAIRKPAEIDLTENISVPDNAEIQETIPPVYKPYSPSKNEVIFSYTKNLINAINPTPITNLLSTPQTTVTEQILTNLEQRQS